MTITDIVRKHHDGPKWAKVFDVTWEENWIADHGGIVGRHDFDPINPMLKLLDEFEIEMCDNHHRFTS